ncbi:hypothetical protein BD309DRAFT_913913 [Dichomitus squalens]|uniref:Uncharacterized protein n=1 Tax=Dichomitus squalens TaxID=114155 RepID=A0A4Q9Q3Z0_9APHY|nr:hypothetical protein BD309DRAFT_913913 [Dichomitus squalens]TBU61889.1 hypothetical protein BD310DRAFT_844984 [Dichomitus squalens]
MSATTAVHIPTPKVPCHRCKQIHDTPAAVLMACAKCERAWHHTCHVPPVSEKEILERIDLDKQGKRDVGLRAWQCRRCTKKIRVEPPPPALPAAGPSDGTTQTFVPRLQFDSSSSEHPHSLGQVTTNIPPRARPSAPVPTLIIEDEDITIVDDCSQQCQPIIAQNNPAGKDPPVIERSPGNQPQKPRAPVVVLPEPPHTVASTWDVSNAHPLTHGNSRNQNSTRLSKTAQKRPMQAPLTIAPLHAAGGSAITYAGPSARPGRSFPSPPDSPHPRPTRTALTSPRPDQSPSPHPHPVQPEPPVPQTEPQASIAANTKTISSADIRALISNMRSDGRLAPPPDVQYIHTRARNPDPAFVTFQAGPSLRPSQSRARKLAYELTINPGLEAAEPKLNDPDKREMDVDGRGRSEPEPEPTPLEEFNGEAGQELEDPHNIDDLYGDVAPRYRNQPPRRSKSKTIPPPSPPQETTLLFSALDKRPSKPDALGLLLDKQLRIEENRRAKGNAASRPRKLVAPQELKGKALKRKQKTGLYFSIHEEREQAAAG